MTVASEIEYAIACLDEVQKNLALAVLHLQIAQKAMANA